MFAVIMKKARTADLKPRVVFIFYIVTSPVRLSAPSRVTTCLTLENNNQKSNKQAMLSDIGAKETILNFILFINISFMHSCH